VAGGDVVRFKRTSCTRISRMTYIFRLWTGFYSKHGVVTRVRKLFLFARIYFYTTEQPEWLPCIAGKPCGTAAV
jgi:hypothetical protein